MQKYIHNNDLRDLINEAIGGYKVQHKLEDLSESTANNGIVKVDQDIVNRTKQRLYTEEIRRQENLEDVFEYADKELSVKATNKASKERVDEDWTLNFVRLAKDVTEDSMKRMWGKLLSGEIMTPGSYSLRMMILLSQLSKHDAEIIRSFLNKGLFSDGRQKAVILKDKDNNGINFSQLLYMMELGLIDSSESLALTYNNEGYKTAKRNILFERNGIGLSFAFQTEKMEFPIYRFTNIGRELLLLDQDVDVDIEYLRSCSQTIYDDRKQNVDIHCSRVFISEKMQWVMEKDNHFFDLKGL